MLVDARWPPPEPEPSEPRSFPWAAVWPLLTVGLLGVGFLLPSLIAYLCLLAALYCAVESFALLVPRGDGLDEYRQ